MCASRPPAEQIVLEAVDFAKQQNIDVVLGFGGGSAMDVAKLLLVLSHPCTNSTTVRLGTVSAMRKHHVYRSF